MKVQNLLLGAIICGSLTSCFKDEPLNAECDIEQAYVHADDPTEIFFAARLSTSFWYFSLYFLV